MRLPILTGAVLVSMMVGLPVARAAARVAPDQFLISYWSGPPPEATTLARYQEIAAAGFNVAMPPCSGPITPALDQQILQYCTQTGLKAIIEDPRLDAAQGAANSTGVGAALDAVVADYAASPALYGYYLRDEPAVAQFPRLAEMDHGLRARDPLHLPYVNLFPNYATPQQLGAPTYRQYVQQFLGAVQPELLSYDHYALLNSGVRPEYFENLEIIRQQALQAGVPFASILLVTPHGPYIDPNEAELRWQIYTSLVYGARGILYFTYWTPHYGPNPFYDAILDDQGRETGHYDQVRRLNGELSALGPTLAGLQSVGVYHTGLLPSGTQGLPVGGLVRSANGGDAVIGLFQRVWDSWEAPPPPPSLAGTVSSEYMMLVNRNMQSGVLLHVSLARQITGIAEVSRATGLEGPAQLPTDGSQNSFDLYLAPGDGRLFALKDSSAAVAGGPTAPGSAYSGRRWGYLAFPGSVQGSGAGGR